MRGVAFAKYEGTGNDFVVIDSAHDDAVSVEDARSLCDRRRGVGADGVLLVLPPRTSGAAARMRVLNADGSIPEMCGNGLRCVALHVARARGVVRGELAFDTDSGLRRCDVERSGDAEAMVTVDMGVVRVTGESEIDGVVFTLADAGNPHAVAFGRYDAADVARIGPRVATHASFPRGTNVELAEVGAAGGRIALAVWERGVGITQACGTGACATVAAAIARGLVPRGEAVVVSVPGGELRVSIDAAGAAVMRGPARRVFEGRA
jgi:diaminopimelate epimerase